MTRRPGTVLVLLSLAAACLSGCTAVKPWERDILARRDMAWEPDPLEGQRRGHVYFSKEAALLGGGASGGGCGCN